MANNTLAKYTNNVYDFGKTVVGTLTATTDSLTYDVATTLNTTAPAEGWRLTELRLMNAGTVATVSISIGSAYNSNFLFGKVVVAARAGMDGATAACDALSTTLFPSLMVDTAGNKYVDIQSGYTIWMSCGTNHVTAFAIIYDYKA